MMRSAPPAGSRRLRSAVLLTLFCLSLPLGLPALATPEASSAAGRTYYADDPGQWATPQRWEAPVYPASLLAQQVSGRVDVLVKISAEGRLAEIVALRADPPQPAFEEAVRTALRDWSFRKALDGQCRPMESQGRVQVRFAVRDGQPEVTVGAAPATPPADRARIQEVNGREVQTALLEAYPREARRMGQMGDVHVLLRVDPRTGETRDVEVIDVQADTSSYNPEQRPFGGSRTPGRSSPASIQFAAAVRDPLLQLRFSPPPDAGQAPVSVCREVSFRIQGVRRK